MPKSTPPKLPAGPCPIGKRCLCKGLPPRLRQVFHRLLLGDIEKQIAAALGLSAHTLHGHIKRLYRHFNVGGRAEFMALALSTVRRPRAIRHDLGLNESQRKSLLGLIDSGSQDSRRRAIRARILLQCDGHRDDYEIADETGVSIRTIERIRQKFLCSGIRAVSRKPQSLKLAKDFSDLRRARR